MSFLRIVGLVLAVGGLGYVVLGILGVSLPGDGNTMTYALFAMLLGLLLAMAANAGQKMGVRSKDKGGKKGGK